jgi:hypothetical protein
MARIDPLGRALEVQDEGISLGTVTILNFSGANVEASPDGTTRVTVHIPPPPIPTFASHLGTTDGTTNGHIGWPSTTAGLVSEPTTPGSPFYPFSQSGDWANPNAAHPLDRNASESAATIGRVTELNVGTMLRVRFYRYTSSGGGQQVIGEETIACNGSNQASVPYGYLHTTGVSLNNGKYEGTVQVSIPISTLLAFGGYLRTLVTHEGAAPGFPYSEGWEVFSDAYATPPVPSGISIVEAAAVLKHLSGIRFYNVGSTFNAGGAVADAFKSTYHASPLLLDLTSLGVSSPTSLPYNDSGITPAHPPTPKYNDALGWTKNVAVTMTGLRNMNAQPRQRAQDPWGVSSYDVFAGGPMVDTVAASSTRLDEKFDDEDYRAVIKATWPTAPTCPPVAGDKFDSLVPLDNGANRGAQVYGGDLVYPAINFLIPAGRKPAQQVGTDYSTMTGSREYQRPFQHNTSPDTRSNVVLYLPGYDVTALGDISPAGSGDINLQLYIPGVSPVWFDVGREYFSALFPTPEPGCLVKSLSGVAGGYPTNEYWYCTFGTFSTIPGDRMIVLWVTLRTAIKGVQRVLAYNWT